MDPRPVERVMVVEDSPPLRRTLQVALAERFADVRTCASVADARGLIDGWVPDLVLLDVALPDGDAFDVLDILAAASPQPTVVAISGEAEPEQSFALAKRGVHEYLSKPVELDDLRSAVDRALSSAPALGPQLRASVGQRPIREVEREVRETMVDEALARAQGSRRGAAKLLSISRQLLQYILRRKK